MVITLIIILIIALIGLTAVKRQERLIGVRRNQRKLSRKDPGKDYLDKIMKSTNLRLEEERLEEEYKNKIAKKYL